MKQRISPVVKFPLLMILILLLGLTVAPFLWTVLTSIKTKAGIYSWPPQWIPKPVTWEHYRELFERMDFSRYLLNSIIVTSCATALSLFLNALGGYTFAKFQFPLKKLVFTLILLSMMVPAQVTLIPVFLTLKSMGLLNNYLGLILPAGVSAFGLFLMRQYMYSIPDSYIESARMDGCSEFRIFWSVVLPLCHPILTALAIFTFTLVWSDFMMPLIIMHKESMYTLPVALANLSGQHQARWGLQMAGATVTILPIAVAFLILQRKFIEGVTMTGMKG